MKTNEEHYVILTTDEIRITYQILNYSKKTKLSLGWNCSMGDSE
jgi:hypothetical protein